jgi:hypothetical protein
MSFLLGIVHGSIVIGLIMIITELMNINKKLDEYLEKQKKAL